MGLLCALLASAGPQSEEWLGKCGQRSVPSLEQRPASSHRPSILLLLGRHVSVGWLQVTRRRGGAGEDVRPGGEVAHLETVGLCPASGTWLIERGLPGVLPATFSLKPHGGFTRPCPEGGT